MFIKFFFKINLLLIFLQNLIVNLFFISKTFIKNLALLSNKYIAIPDIH